MNAKRPRVICLSGSMRFEAQMRAAAVDLSLEGAIVTGPFVNMKKPDPRWATDKLADPIKVALDQLHFRKIDLADEVVVVSDETGYVGESTRNEITYAEKHGKPVRYMRIAAVTSELDRLRERCAMHERIRFEIEEVLDRALGTKESDGAGAGLVADVALLAERLDKVRKALKTPEEGWAVQLHALHVRQECDRAVAARDMLAWLHAEAVWHWGQLSARPTVSAYEAACEALEKRRVALVAALRLPTDEAFYTAVECAAKLAAPGSESVPATPEPAEDQLSIVAHPELDFPDCLTEFHRGVVYGYRRAIGEFEARCFGQKRADVAQLWDAIGWLEEQIRKYQDRSAQAQGAPPSPAQEGGTD